MWKRGREGGEGGGMVGRVLKIFLLLLIIALNTPQFICKPPPRNQSECGKIGTCKTHAIHVIVSVDIAMCSSLVTVISLTFFVIEDSTLKVINNIRSTSFRNAIFQSKCLPKSLLFKYNLPFTTKFGSL